MADLVAAAPFVEWVAERVAARGAVEVARQMRVDDRQLWRWRNSLDGNDCPTDTFPRAAVEDALHLSGAQMWEVYPDLDEEEGGRGFCPGCHEEVATDASGRCLWCEAKTTSPPAGRRRGWRRAARLSDAHLRALHLIHVREQLSIRELGRRIYRQAGYSSAKTAAGAISEGWKRLRLPARPQEQATALANVQRRLPGSPGTADRAAYERWLRERSGRRRLCAGVKLTYPDKGRPCERWAQAGSDYCLQHDPARRAEVVELAERARAGTC